MLPVSKIYVDTKYKTADSLSSSDFKIELPETLTLPPNTKAYLTDITMVNTMTTSIKDYNDTLYWCKVQYNKLAQPCFEDIRTLPHSYTGGQLHG